MKKYYDLYKSRLVYEFHFKAGVDMSIDVLKIYLKIDDARELARKILTN